MSGRSRQIGRECIHQVVEGLAAQHPDALALASPGRATVTYGLLCRQVEDVIETLLARGYGRGDRVALVLPSGPDMIAAFLGVAACAACSPLNPDYREREFLSYLSDLNATALVVAAGRGTAARSAAQTLGIPILELRAVENADAGVFEIAADSSARGVGRGRARPDDDALVVLTSGTTSRPRWVPLTHLNVGVCAANTAGSLALSAGDRYLNVMPLYHTHGMQRTLAMLQSGGSVFCPEAFDLKEFFRWWEEFRPTWYSAAPPMHQAILSQAATHRRTIERHPLRLVSTSSAPLAPKIRERLEDALNAPLIEFYGCAETTPIACTPLPPRQRKRGSVGVPAGPEVAVTDESGARVTPGQTGEIVVRGPGVVRHYLDNAEADRDSFRNGWFRTGDQGFFDSDGYLFLTGRLKEMINRGGEKVSPQEIDEVLLGHPAVEEAAAFPIQHSSLGEEVAAAIVLRPGSTAGEAELRRFAAERMADFKVPCRILIVAEIPKSPTGKVQRAGLAKRLGLMSSGEPGSVGRGATEAPGTALEEWLVREWQRLLGVEQLGVHDNFFELGGDSLLVMQLLAQLESTHHVRVPLPHFFDGPTVSALAVAIVEAQARQVRPEATSRASAGLHGVPDPPVPQASRETELGWSDE